MSVPIEVGKPNYFLRKAQFDYDTAHYEYHPGIDIASYRKLPLAEREFNQAQKRAKRYA